MTATEAESRRVETLTIKLTEMVVQVPEPVSPTYRSRVRRVSCRYRSQGVVQVPDQHRSGLTFLERKTGFEPATLTLAR